MPNGGADDQVPTQNSEIEIQINFVNVQYTYHMLVDIYEFWQINHCLLQW